MKKNHLALALITLALHGPFTRSAAADVLFQNSSDFQNRGDCNFNLTCSTAAGYHNVFAGQEFNLTNASVLTSGSFVELTLDSNFLGNVKLPTAVNWLVLAANGPNGLPGSVLAQGSDTPIALTQTAGNPATEFYPYYEQSFSLPSVELASGNYYLAIQALQSDSGVYLSQGVLQSGAAFTDDGGAQWVPGFSSITSAAVSLDGTVVNASVPEPATLELMVLGLVGVGLVRLRCKTRSATPQ